MYCHRCHCHHNPNVRCGCYRTADGKLIPKKKTETEEEYLQRCNKINKVKL
jgi:hypothetical protein